MFFERPSKGSWGQHGTKILPKWWPGGRGGLVPLCSCFRAWKGLGGVLGPLGAQELILVDFWLIFDGFLDDFSMIFDNFLIDF